MTVNTSSFIQTSRPGLCASLSVPEFHRVCRCRLADFTADREFHPALKTLDSVVPLFIIHLPARLSRGKAGGGEKFLPPSFQGRRKLIYWHGYEKEMLIWGRKWLW